MKITVVRPNDLGETEIAAWREMQRAQPHLANPFLSPDFTLAMGEVSSDTRVAVITESAGPVGFFPFEVHARGVGGAIGSWVSLSQGVIHSPGAVFDSDALLKACGLHVWEFGCMVERQPWFQPYETLRQEAVVLDLADGYPAYLEGLRERSPKFLKTTLYKERKLSRDAGKVTFDFAVRDEEQFRLLRSWKSAQYLRMGRADRFGKAWMVELAERLHAIDSPDFGGPLSMLYIDGQPVAGHFGLRSHVVLAGWFPAYDPAYSKYSPGLIQHLRMAESAAELGIRSMDLGVGVGSEYKQALRSSGTPVAEGVVRRRTAGARAHWLRNEPGRRVRRFILETPAVYGLVDKTMKKYGELRTRSS